MAIELQGFDDLKNDLTNMAYALDQGPGVNRALKAGAVPIEQQMLHNASTDPKIITDALHSSIHTGSVKKRRSSGKMITIGVHHSEKRYQEEHAEATAEVTKLEGQVKALQKTMQNSADAASKAATDLNNAKAAARETDAEIKKLTEELYRMKNAWTQAGTTLTNFSKKCGTLSKALTKAGKTLTTTVTTPIVGLGTTAVKASI